MSNYNLPPCTPYPVPGWSLILAFNLHPRDWGFDIGKRTISGQRNFYTLIGLLGIMLIENACQAGELVNNSEKFECNEKCKQEKYNCPVDCCLFCGRENCPGKCYYKKN